MYMHGARTDCRLHTYLQTRIYERTVSYGQSLSQTGHKLWEHRGPAVEYPAVC